MEEETPGPFSSHVLEALSFFLERVLGICASVRDEIHSWSGSHKRRKMISGMIELHEMLSLPSQILGRGFS